VARPGPTGTGDGGVLLDTGAWSECHTPWPWIAKPLPRTWIRPCAPG
jgi:hypothetical protein